MRTLPLACLLCATCIALSPGAFAQPAGSESPAASKGADAQAKALFELGTQRYEEARYAEAIEAFEEAYRLSERPALLYNLANANERMGNVKAAIRHLEQYKPNAPADEQQTIDRRLANLRERLPTETPQPAIEPSLVPQPATTPGPAPASAPAPGPDQGAAAGDEDGSGLVLAGGVLLGIGSAALVVGGILGGLTLSERSTAEDNCSGGFCTQEGLDAADREENLALGTDLAIGLGGATAVTGLIMLIIGATDDGSGGDVATMVVPTPLRGGGGALLFRSNF
jgi:tetratricopeptide (TPR) repeat protein